MSLQSLTGRFPRIGPLEFVDASAGASLIQSAAANAAAIFIGRMVTSDGGTHTIDTTGSSSIGWQTGSVTFANAGSTGVVGIAPLDTSTGPPPRASNTAGVINFDVKASFTGGGGGITANAWQTSVPTSGSKTIADGDLVAIAFQLTARGGSDLVQVAYMQPPSVLLRPAAVQYNGSTFSAQTGMPNFFITFSDGAYGWIETSDIFSSLNTRAWNNTSGTREYGQLYQLPFPVSVVGIYGLISPASNSADLDVILYSDPLGTPVARGDAFVDANTVTTTGAFRYFEEHFSSPYSVAANAPIGAVIKPAASANVQIAYKTLASAAHRVADPWGTTGYGISRGASGAFANANSSLDHYYLGLLIKAFDGGGGGLSPAPIVVGRGAPF